MSGSANTFVQSLESRLFLSATVHTSASSATILADRQQIEMDRSAASHSYSSDYAKVQADQAKKKADLAPLKAKLEADKSACYATLLSDEQAIAAARKAGGAVVQGDEQALKTDANDAGKLEADKQKLMDDYKAFSDTLSALKTKRTADTAACEAKVRRRQRGDHSRVRRRRWHHPHRPVQAGIGPRPVAADHPDGSRQARPRPGWINRRINRRNHGASEGVRYSLVRSRSRPLSLCTHGERAGVEGRLRM